MIPRFFARIAGRTAWLCQCTPSRSSCANIAIAQRSLLIVLILENVGSNLRLLERNVRMLNLVRKAGWQDCECPREQGSVSVREARNVVFEMVTSIPDTQVANLANVTGRVLARPICTESPLPRFDYSAMDGYAINAADIRSGAILNVVGQAAAGRTDIALRLKGNSAYESSRAHVYRLAQTRSSPKKRSAVKATVLRCFVPRCQVKISGFAVRMHGPATRWSTRALAWGHSR